MSRTIERQLPFAPVLSEHKHVQELREMDAILNRIGPEMVPVVRAELSQGSVSKGREGMHADAVIRALVIKQMNDFSYEELAFHLADSQAYRWFCGYGWAEEPPKRSTLQENITRLSAQTLSRISQAVVREAGSEGIEDGNKVRTDTTAIGGPIHPPTDSALLWDVVRVLVRLLYRANEHVDLHWSDHRKRAKRRTVALISARRKRRDRLYKDLLKVTRKTVGYAEEAVEVLQQADMAESAAELSHYIALGWRVIGQTERRILNKESVPVSEKIVSIFEPDTDIIVRGQRDPVFGHKVTLSLGASGMVLDAVVETGNPTDSTLAVDAVTRLQDIYDNTPAQVVMDGGFSSQQNVDDIKKLGVTDVVFSKHLGIDIDDMTGSLPTFRQLRRFRAGVEGCISFLKRCFGLARCTWKGGLKTFSNYVWASIVSANLLTFARRRLQT